MGLSSRQTRKWRESQPDGAIMLLPLRSYTGSVVTGTATGFGNRYSVSVSWPKFPPEIS